MGVYSADSVLRPHVVRRALDEMLAGRGPEIAKYVNRMLEENPGMSRADALRSFVQSAKTVDYTGELQAQVHEMGKEVWYLGERLHREPTDEERRAVCSGWSRSNAESWRQHMLRVYGFVIDHDKTYFEQRLSRL